MIILVVTYAHSYTAQDYLNTWGVSLKSRVKILFYEDLYCRPFLPRGAYIFTDLERLSPRQKQQAEVIATYLAEQGLPVLNRPLAVLCRYELLETLHKEGVNPFRAVWLRDVDDSLRYPVFLRVENDHDGPVSGLVYNPRELQVAVLDAVYRGAPPHKLLAVEFCDTADDSGVYRKYSAFLVGDRFVTRHLRFSPGWVVKIVGGSGRSQREFEEEQEYLFREPPPHEEQVRAVFRRAAIDYGRMDYTFLKGRLVVWEINTNPTIATPIRRLNPLRQAAMTEVAARLRAAFEALAEAPEASSGAPLPVPSALRDELGVSERDQWKQPLRQVSRPARTWLRKATATLRGT